MAISKNNPIQKNHFRKHWQERVRVHLDQAGKKKSRRVARATKAKAVAPRPLDLLRPVVRAPTQRYNFKVRSGRGFTLEELKAAGVARRYAQTIGIAVDGRRVNRSVEGFEANVQRLKEYLSRVVVFPRKGEAPKETKQVLYVSKSLPIARSTEIETKAIADVESADAFVTLRKAYSDKRHAGRREKKARDAAAAAENK